MMDSSPSPHERENPLPPRQSKDTKLIWKGFRRAQFANRLDLLGNGANAVDFVLASCNLLKLETYLEVGTHQDIEHL